MHPSKVAGRNGKPVPMSCWQRSPKLHRCTSIAGKTETCGMRMETNRNIQRILRIKPEPYLSLHRLITRLQRCTGYGIAGVRVKGTYQRGNFSGFSSHYSEEVKKFQICGQEFQYQTLCTTSSVGLLQLLSVQTLALTDSICGGPLLYDVPRYVDRMSRSVGVAAKSFHLHGPSRFTHPTAEARRVCTVESIRSDVSFEPERTVRNSSQGPTCAPLSQDTVQITFNLSNRPRG